MGTTMEISREGHILSAKADVIRESNGMKFQDVDGNIGYLMDTYGPQFVFYCFPT